MDTIPQDDVPHKQCTGDCKQWLPATPEFFRHTKRGKYGLRSHCKACDGKWAKAHNSQPEVKARTNARRKERYHTNPEVRTKELIAKRAYSSRPDVKERRKDRDRERQSIPGVLEQLRAISNARASRPESKERRRYRYHNYPDVHERILKEQKATRSRPEFRERSRPKKRIQASHRRAQLKTISGNYTLAQIQDLLKRQKYRCYYAACGHARFEKRNGKYIYHIEHTFPTSRVAGSDIPANDINYLVLACPSCNSKKCDKFPWEWPEGGRLL